MLSLRYCLLTWTAALFLAGACAEDDSLGFPEPEDLFGTWKSHDLPTDEVRVFVFEEQSDAYPELVEQSHVYRLYFFHSDETPLVVQRGSYGIEDRHLVTHVTWSSWDGMGRPGYSYTNEIYVWNGSSFMMESRTTASNQREWRRTNETFAP